MEELGSLSKRDPMYDYLRYSILNQLGVNRVEPNFKVFGLQGSNHIYMYEDRASHVRVVGKFFADGSNRPFESTQRRMDREFDNLNYLRSIGFTNFPHYVARPLGRNKDLGCLLVTEWCMGAPLAEFIVRAATGDAPENLYQKLASAAEFFASLHNWTANGRGVDFNAEKNYLSRIITQLREDGLIGDSEAAQFHYWKDRWGDQPCVWEDQQVVVHGDATPANLLMGDGPWVIILDLERMKVADRVFDVGLMAGELKHFFMQHTSRKDLAEPFIGHFLWQYCTHFPDRESAFASITRRIPFYMGMTLLRVARNHWFGNSYRRWLIDEARDTLRIR
jgi:aminoglycoside phosphotransferase (APT) family kinase protein